MWRCAKNLRIWYSIDEDMMNYMDVCLGNKPSNTLSDFIQFLKHVKQC